MKNILKKFGAGFAVATFLTTVANASVVYDWVNAAGTPANALASGTLTVSGGTISSLVFTIQGLSPSENTFSGTIAVLGADQDLTLNGTMNDPGDPSLPSVAWSPTGSSASAGENSAKYTVRSATTIDGDWVAAVPEPTSMVAGALLLLPFGVSAVRMLRRRQAA
jgi:hypothetical protein